MFSKIFIIFMMFIIFSALLVGLFYLVRDQGKSKRTVGALTIRIVLSVILFFMIMISFVHADTIERYMNIVDNLPKMDMRADQEAQIWARSARKVLALTSESIAETLTLANQVAMEKGGPLFCLPPNTVVDGPYLNELIPKFYRDLATAGEVHANATVSEVALLVLKKNFPCHADGVSVGHSPREMFTDKPAELLHVSARD